MSEKELEAELARLKDELKEWKAKYEDAVKQRKEIESKLGAASDEKPLEDEGEKVPIPPRPAGRAVPSETPTSPPATPSTTSATATPASTEGDPTPRRVPIKPPAPGLGGVKIPVLDRSKKDLKEIDKEDILAKTYLKKLYMFQNHITSIPSDIGNLTELQVLDMKYNRVQTIPDAFCSLAALTELLLTGNAITSLPKDLSKLSLLAKLDLAENRIASFPKEILTLPALTDLNLERNKLRELPQEIDQLAALTKLNLSENKLTALPPQIGHLANLGELLINSNRLSTVPADIGHLVYLHNLQLANNSITSLPDDICYLTALTKLGLKNNALSSLPETVAVDEEKGWYSLTNLNLAKNKFTHIPPALWTIEAIEELNFTSNKLKELPSEISHLYSLRSLMLGNNEIPSVPVEISHLEALENLHLFFNRIEHLPDEIAHLYNLRVLFLGYNKLKSVPDLSGLAALEQLFLGGNPELGKGLHESVWGLNTLHHLFLQNTGIEAIPPAVSALTSLSIFDVSANKLKAIPPELSKCEMLSRINASHNQLSTLPDDLDDLRELIELDISSNKFEALPPVYGYVKERVEFLLDNNPFKEPLDEASHPHQWVSSARFHYDAAEMLGRRPTMEDAFSFRGTFMGKENMDYFGLYDGHAGRIAATFCGEHVHKLLAAKIAAGAKDPSAAIAECFREVNIKFKEFLETADSSHRHAGTTGVAILIVDNKVHLANVGDTRVVLNRGGKAIRLSFDHKPNSDEEEARIRALGGFVIGETSRVNGLLAVSRSIGDFYMHPFVSDESYLNNAELTGEDTAIIIACDGLWDEVTDEEAVALLEGENDPFLMSAKLRDMSYLLGSDDNISVNVILLKKK